MAEIRAEPKSTEGFIPTARGRVRPADLDSAGHFGLAAIVHRFTDACIQAGSAIGMDSEYMEKSRRGFSTFELALRIGGALGLLPDIAGEPVTLQRLFAYAFRPVMWLIGIPGEETAAAASLMGTETVLNEFIAYVDLAHLPRPDPFLLFAGYPTGLLEPDMVVSLMPGATPQQVEACHKSPLADFAMAILPELADMIAVVRRLAAEGSMTAADLAEAVAPGRSDRLYRGLVWMAKMDLVHIAPPAGGATPSE